MNNESGCYRCKKCKLYFKVKTTCFHARKIYPKYVDQCPHCKSKKIEPISEKKFKEKECKLKLSVKRNGIEFSTKY